MLILGIETSCDETGIALYDAKRGLLADGLHSQVALHAEFGGVVPELASRDHVQKLLPLLEQVMAEAGVVPADIEGIAYTAGPGLAGALLVGACMAHSLGFAWGVPIIGVHHMEAHLLAPMLEPQSPPFPAVALLVSGGHTLLAEVEAMGHYRVLGESLDDAAGEAFDKTAKLLGLPYPGGVALAALAKQGDPTRFRFPRPMVDRPGLDFSFSGLKTSAINCLRAEGDDDQTRADIACAFEAAVVETLTLKCHRAIRETGRTTLIVAGGVSANKALRSSLNTMAKAEQLAVYYPRHEFCTDNGAMVAYTGCQHLLRGQQTEQGAINIYPRWSLSDLQTPSSKI